jgi:hypothetical protein
MRVGFDEEARGQNESWVWMFGFGWTLGGLRTGAFNGSSLGRK